MNVLTRRDVVKLGAMGLFAFEVDGVERLLSPAEARAQGARFAVLTEAEAATVDAAGETLLPGAAAAGIAPFIDSQLRAEPNDALLMLRYLDVPPPYAAFYRTGLAGLDRLSREAHGQPFVALAAAARRGVVASLRQSDFLFYFALRADAVDVVYGMPESAARLGVPYMSHVPPPRPW